jgi:hypothetical protein
MNNLEKMASIPGYDLLGTYEAGMPVYRVQLRVRARKHQMLPALPEYALKLIGYGINTEDQLCKALGIENEFVQNALEHLNSLQLIKSTINFSFTHPLLEFSLTSRGEEAINKTLMSSYDTSMYLLIDGITGQFSAINKDLFLSDGPELKKQGILPIHSAPKIRPNVENLNKSLSTLIKIYRSQQDEIDNTDQLIEILDVPYSRLLYKVVSILVLRNRQDGLLKLKVFEGYESLPEHEEKLSERERNGSRVIPDEILVNQTDFTPSNLNKELNINISVLQKQQTEIEELKNEKDLLVDEIQADEIKNPDLLTGKTKRIQELEKQLETLINQYSSTRLITASEHSTKLQLALRSAKEFVLIVSPWIRRSAVDEAEIELIKNAVQRGVWIIIGYGMPLRDGETKEDYLQKWVASRFTSIQAAPGGNRLFYAWLGTHEKILVCDKTFSVISSLNWLSYRGDKGFRREIGTYTEDPRVVNQAIEHFLNEFKTLPDGFKISA